MSGERSAVKALAAMEAEIIRRVSRPGARLHFTDRDRVARIVRDVRAAIAEDEARAGQGSEAGT